MDGHTHESKGFGPQLFPEGEPTNEWQIEQLGCYAHSQQQRIEEQERLATPAYWRLGKALCFAKKSFGHGQWEKFLEHWRIDKTRASKARAIFAAFESESSLQDISVEEAYRQRKKRPLKERRKLKRQSRGNADLCNFFSGVSKNAETLIDSAAFVEPANARDLLPAVEEAIKGLERLRSWLKEQAEKATTLLAPQ